MDGQENLLLRWARASARASSRATERALAPGILTSLRVATLEKPRPCFTNNMLFIMNTLRETTLDTPDILVSAIEKENLGQEPRFFRVMGE
jgi:hypothetical protein